MSQFNEVGAYTHLRASDERATEPVFDPINRLTISTLLKILRQNGWWTVLAVIVAVGGTAVVLHMIPPRYEADATLQISKLPVPTPNADADPSLQANESVIDDAAMNTEIEAITARPVVNDVISRLHLERDSEFNPLLAASSRVELREPLSSLITLGRDIEAKFKSFLTPNQAVQPDENESVASSLMKAVAVSVKGRSRVIAIQVSSLDPAKAAAIANAFARSFVNNRQERQQQYRKQITDWLNARLTQLRGAVLHSDEQVEQVRTEVGQYQGQNSTSLLSEELSQTTRQLLDAQAEQAQAHAKIDQLSRLERANNLGAADNVLSSPLITSLRQQEAQLRTQLNEELSRLGPKHPDVISVQAQVAQIDKELSNQIQRVTKNASDQVNVLNSRVDSLVRARDDLKQRIDKQNASLVSLNELRNNADSDRKAFEAFAIYHDKMVGLAEVEQPEASLLSAAVAPLSPSYPRPLLILALATIATLALSIAYALLRRGLYERFLSAQDVAIVLGLPTLAAVPKFSRKFHLRDNSLGAERSPAAEAIRYLYADLERYQQAPLKVLITSSLPGEGKTTTATMLAREAAIDGRLALLIDLDIRQIAPPPPASTPRIARLPAAARFPFEPVLDVEPTTGLTRLSFRTSLPHPFRLLYTEQFWRDLSNIMGNYDLIVINSPPILAVPDAKVIAGYVDETVFIVKWGSTRFGSAAEGVRHFRSIGCKVSGVVLTQVKPQRYAYETDYVRAYSAG